MAYHLKAAAKTASPGSELRLREPQTHVALRQVSVTGLRYYSPVLVRWLSRDPIGEYGGLNLYEWCLNNGHRIDKRGLSLWDPGDVVVIIEFPGDDPREYPLCGCSSFCQSWEEGGDLCIEGWKYDSHSTREIFDEKSMSHDTYLKVTCRSEKKACLCDPKTGKWCPQDYGGDPASVTFEELVDSEPDASLIGAPPAWGAGDACSAVQALLDAIGIGASWLPDPEDRLVKLGTKMCECLNQKGKCSK